MSTKYSMREPRSAFSAHQEIILGLTSVSIHQAHQRPPRAFQKPIIRVCVYAAQTGALLVLFALIGTMLAY